MIEFYLKYYISNLKSKSIELVDELKNILLEDNVSINASNENSIPIEIKNKINKDVFYTLNDIYYTIRKQSANNELYKKYLPEVKKEPNGILFADFFSGAGGLSQGFINAGLQSAFVNDIYLPALETYYFNHTLPLNRFFNGSIEELVNNFSSYNNLFNNVKIICGGPPCQGFSNANRWNFEIDETTKEKRFIEDERNILYKYFIKLIGLISPDFFVMENVKGMIKVINQIKEDIKSETKMAYSFFPLIMEAKNYDIPQSRSRFILIGGKDFKFIEKLKRNLDNKISLKCKYTLKDALFGLPVIGTNPIKLKPEFNSEKHGYTIRKYKIEQNEFLRWINKGRKIEYVFNHKSRYNNENDLEIYRKLPEGENSLHPSVQNLSKYNNRNHIFKDKYYKLKRNEISKTITSHMKNDCHMYIHPKQTRGLSPREAARIQTFPDDFMFRGSLNDWYKQIGNAVPVKLAEVIGEELKEYYS